MKETTGIEVQVDWHATDNLSFGANIFAASNEFKDDFCSQKYFFESNFVDGVAQPCPLRPDGTIQKKWLDIKKGMPLPNAPDRYIVANINYSIPDVLGGDLWLYYDFTYSSEVWNETYDIVENDRRGLSPSWTYHTLSAGLQLPNQWDVEVHIRNLTDQSGYSYTWTGESDEAETFHDPRYRRLRAQERPRTIWLSVRKGFGGT